MLEVRFLVGNGRPSMLMFVRSAAALATMRPALLLRALKKAPRPSTSYHLVEKEYKCIHGIHTQDARQKNSQ